MAAKKTNGRFGKRGRRSIKRFGITQGRSRAEWEGTTKGERTLRTSPKSP